MLLKFPVSASQQGMQSTATASGLCTHGFHRLPRSPLPRSRSRVEVFAGVGWLNAAMIRRLIVRSTSRSGRNDTSPHEFYRLRPCPTRCSFFDTRLFPCVTALGPIFSPGAVSPKLEHPVKPSIGPFKVTTPGRHWRTGLANSSTLDRGRGSEKARKANAETATRRY